MTNPRSLVRTLYEHWDSIEHLVLMSREFPAFELDQALAVIAKIASAKTLEAQESALRQMVSAELLQALPRGTALQIHPQVLEFVRGLIREHELGLSEVLKARIDAIKSATERLVDGLRANNPDLLRQAAVQLAELFRQISRQLEQDRHAILELAERAKARDANLPIARRYSEVLEAYDGYVEPMVAMMDSGPSGTFYRHLEAAEHALDHAVDALTVQGALYSQRLTMRQVAFQAKELRRFGREVMNHCMDTLMPLREEIRQHNALSSAITQWLGRIRKRGLDATFKGADLPVWKREMPRRVSVGAEVLAIMAEGMRYQPTSLNFPSDERGEEDGVVLEWVDEEALVRELRIHLPVANLLQWLHGRHPQLGDATLLRLYHGLLERQDWQIRVADQITKQILNTVSVTHYPHALYPQAERILPQ